MPDVRNCRKCGKIFNYLGGVPICPVCKQEDEEDFKRVKQYLYDNPGASMSQISTELDISVEKIKRYLKEGRLEIIGEESNLVLECESCGKSIRTGRFCAECERELARGFQETANRMSTSRSAAERRSEFKYLHKETKK
ncbi:MAG: MerR family transcriptional regulator [Acetivibrionales bacterium]